MAPPLTRLYELLACPQCRSALRSRADGLRCGRCGRRYPVVNGVPVLLPEGGGVLPRDPALPVRSGYDPWIYSTVLESLPADAVTLEIGAGNMAASRPNVIRMDVTLTPFIDVVGDAHALPFRSGCLDFVFSLAVLEHLRHPFEAAEETFRVLRNGGYVYAECAFVFPFHGHPNHYFNASHLGLRELFRSFTPLRVGVAPYQMPSYALRALLETYCFFLGPHDDADARRMKERIGAVLGEDLAGLDQRFSQESALRCAACTYLFGVKAPDATEVIPAPVLEAHRLRPPLQQRYPTPVDIADADNLLAWARGDEARADSAIAAHLARVVPFEKDAPFARARRSAAPKWLSRAARGARRLGGRLRRTLRDRHGRAPRAVRDILDRGERVTHLFPNDCYVAHLSIYRLVRPSVAGAAVLDAGSGAGYGAAYLADHGARQVLGIDASAKAVAFSRQHFPRPNLRFEVMGVERLDGLDAGAWDVVVCSNVLEHVRDVGAFLRGVCRLLGPRGALVVAVPPIVNESLRMQNLATPYHLNIWSPRQWAHVLGRYFAEVETLQHWYEKPGVELNLLNSPADTVIGEDDFVFRRVAVEELYDLPTISAVFTARRPRPAEHLPDTGAPLDYVDDSFTRPPPAPGASRAVRALRALRARATR